MNLVVSVISTSQHVSDLFMLRPLTVNVPFWEGGQGAALSDDTSYCRA